MDFTELTGAVSATAVVAAIGAMAVVKFSPRVAAWGYNTVMRFFGR